MDIRSGVLNKIYGKKRLIRNFDFDNLQHLPLRNFISREDVAGLKYLSTSAKYSGISKNEKLEMMSQILIPRGFKKMTTGTNRAIYTFDNDQSFLIKVALDDIGIRDSPAEMFNQQILKPFIPKVFDTTPCGTVGMYERVDPILNRYEFENVADEIFDIMQNFFLGRYVLEDIGNDFFKNWGLRYGFGPVLLDFPYLYEIDGSKLKCNKQLMDGSTCSGEIDYDDGLNTLVCEHCGQRYAAKDLGANNGALSVKEKKEESIMIENFKVMVEKDGKVYNVDEGSDFIVPGKKNNCVKRTGEDFKVTVVGGEPILPYKEPIKVPPKDFNASEAMKESVPEKQPSDYFKEGAKDARTATVLAKKIDTVPLVKLKEIQSISDNFVKPVETAEETSATDLILINAFLDEKVRDFDFSLYADIVAVQKDALTDFLFTCVVAKYQSLDTSKASQIVEEYIQRSYRFVDAKQEQHDNAEKLAREYLGGEDIDSMELNEKIPKRRVRDDL